MVELVLDDRGDSRWVFLWDEDRKIDVRFELFDKHRTDQLKYQKPLTLETFKRECEMHIGAIPYQATGRFK